MVKYTIFNLLMSGTKAFIHGHEIEVNQRLEHIKEGSKQSKMQGFVYNNQKYEVNVTYTTRMEISYSLLRLNQKIKVWASYSCENFVPHGYKN